MRDWAVAVMTMVLCAAAPAWSQDLSPEELRRRYDDVVIQLKSAQDRKNELATENEKLHARIAELEQQLESIQAQRDAARRELAELIQQTWFFRAHYAAWQRFISQHPRLKGQWEALFTTPLLDPVAPPHCPLITPDPASADPGLPVCTQPPAS